MEKDLSILFEPIEFTDAAKLEIEPLAPLSMVSTMPGSYYRSLQSPTKYMLCGMLENLLGWHFSEEDRREFRKKIKKAHKNKEEFKLGEAESGYTPLIDHLFEIETKFIPDVIRYDDIWTQHLKRGDSGHLGGLRNYSWEIEKNWQKLMSKTNTVQSRYYKSFKGKFPSYYSSPKSREFIITKSSYIYRIISSKKFTNLLVNSLKTSSTAYLGTSEGWVEVNLEKLL